MKEWSDTHEKESCTLEQALTLMRYGSTFDIQDLQYWRLTRELVEAALDGKHANLDITLDVATHMKEFGLLSNRVLRHLSEYSSLVHKMTTSQLTLFTMIYASEEMRDAIILGK